MAGNSANAAAAATSAVKVSILDPVTWPLDSQVEQRLAQRKAVMKKLKLPTDLETARISEMSPLQIADSKKPVRQAYGFAIKLWLQKVRDVFPIAVFHYQLLHVDNSFEHIHEKRRQRDNSRLK